MMAPPTALPAAADMSQNVRPLGEAEVSPTAGSPGVISGVRAPGTGLLRALEPAR